MTWDKASGKGAVIAAWTGFALAVTGWLIGAKVQGGSISVATLGTNEVMLSGNLIAIISSGIIHYVYSKFIDPQNFDFSTLDSMIHLVENDLSGLGAEQQNKVREHENLSQSVHIAQIDYQPLRCTLSSA